MEDLERYLKDIVEPTVEDFVERPTSVRHAFLACVAVFHSVDYLAYPHRSQKLRQKFGRKSPDFAIVDDVAHAFKHVVAGNPENPNLRSNEVIKRGGAFSSGFSSGFDLGAVTIANRPEVNLLATVKQAVRFLREYKPARRS
jgi:hypothetical protein